MLTKSNLQLILCFWLYLISLYLSQGYKDFLFAPVSILLFYISQLFCNQLQKKLFFLLNSLLHFQGVPWHLITLTVKNALKLAKFHIRLSTMLFFSKSLLAICVFFVILWFSKAAYHYLQKCFWDSALVDQSGEKLHLNVVFKTTNR